MYLKDLSALLTSIMPDCSLGYVRTRNNKFRLQHATKGPQLWEETQGLNVPQSPHQIHGVAVPNPTVTIAVTIAIATVAIAITITIAVAITVVIAVAVTIAISSSR